jgi:hypothetical protein
MTEGHAPEGSGSGSGSPGVVRLGVHEVQAGPLAYGKYQERGHGGVTDAGGKVSSADRL